MKQRIPIKFSLNLSKIMIETAIGQVARDVRSKLKHIDQKSGKKFEDFMHGGTVPASKTHKKAFKNGRNMVIEILENEFEEQQSNQIENEKAFDDRLQVFINSLHASYRAVFIGNRYKIMFNGKTVPSRSFETYVIQPFFDKNNVETTAWTLRKTREKFQIESEWKHNNVDNNDE